jgi:uncharacterized protein YbaR (Trm112 family)
MDMRSMDILRCPVCKSEMELKIQKKEKNEILDGELDCSKCKFTYPIIDGIPNLLPPEYHNK